MSDDNPMFVKITGRGRYQIKPWSRAGWIAMGIWVLLHSAILALLFIPTLREQWWIVVTLDALVTVPLIVWGIRAAVPIEQVRQR